MARKNKRRKAKSGLKTPSNEREKAGIGCGAAKLEAL